MRLLVFICVLSAQRYVFLFTKLLSIYVCVDVCVLSLYCQTFNFFKCYYESFLKKNSTTLSIWVRYSYNQCWTLMSVGVCILQYIGTNFVYGLRYKNKSLIKCNVGWLK